MKGDPRWRPGRRTAGECPGGWLYEPVENPWSGLVRGDYRPTNLSSSSRATLGRMANTIRGVRPLFTFNARAGSDNNLVRHA
jgi:hypothetical protein